MRLVKYTLSIMAFFWLLLRAEIAYGIDLYDENGEVLVKDCIVLPNIGDRVYRIEIKRNGADKPYAAVLMAVDDGSVPLYCAEDNTIRFGVSN